MVKLAPCSLVHLDHLVGSILVAGREALTFLQGQLSCDLNDLTSKRFLWGAHCTLQAKVFSLFRLNLWKEQFLLTTELSCLNASLKKLAFFKLRAQVNLDPLPTHFRRIGLVGTQAAHQLQTAGIKPPNPLSQVEHGEILITALPGPIPRFELLGPESELAKLKTIWEHLPIEPVHLWQYAELQAKLPWLSPKTQGLFFAHELGLYELEAISLKKGCYVGQEIIARVFYKGRPKRTLYLVDPVAANLSLNLSLDQLQTSDDQQLGDLVCSATYQNHLLCLSIQNKLSN